MGTPDATRYAGLCVMFGREAPVAAGPGGRAAAARGAHGHLRASHADREHVISTLKAAFVQGRLTKDELDERVGQTLVSRTHGDLAALTADIPPIPAEAAPARAPARSRPRPVARAGALVAIGPAVLVAAFFTPNDAMFKWLITIMIVYYMALMVAGAVIFDSCQRGSCGRQPPSHPTGRVRAPSDLSLRQAHGQAAQRGRGSPAPRRARRSQASIRATAL